MGEGAGDMMTGSYEKVLQGWSSIENMCDAREVVTELMWLVQSQIGEEKAKRLLNTGFHPMDRGDIDLSPACPECRAFMDVERLMGS